MLLLRYGRKEAESEWETTEEQEGQQETELWLWAEGYEEEHQKFAWVKGFMGAALVAALIGLFYFSLFPLSGGCSLVLQERVWAGEVGNSSAMFPKFVVYIGSDRYHVDLAFPEPISGKMELMVEKLDQTSWREVTSTSGSFDGEYYYGKEVEHSFAEGEYRLVLHLTYLGDGKDEVKTYTSDKFQV